MFDLAIPAEVNKCLTQLLAGGDGTVNSHNRSWHKVGVSFSPKVVKFLLLAFQQFIKGQLKVHKGGLVELIQEYLSGGEGFFATRVDSQILAVWRM